MKEKHRWFYWFVHYSYEAHGAAIKEGSMYLGSLHKHFRYDINKNWIRGLLANSLGEEVEIKVVIRKYFKVPKEEAEAWQAGRSGQACDFVPD